MKFDVKQKQGEYGFWHVTTVEAENAREAVLKVAAERGLDPKTLFALIAKE